MPGSYAPAPYLLTGRYLLGRRLAGRWPVVFTPSRSRYVPLTMDLECIRKHRWNALWPIKEAWESLGRWVDLAMVARVADGIFAGSGGMREVRKLQSVQCLAYRLLQAQHREPGEPNP